MVKTCDRVVLSVDSLFFIEFINWGIYYLFGTYVSLTEMGKGKLPGLWLDGSKYQRMYYISIASPTVVCIFYLALFAKSSPKVASWIIKVDPAASLAKSREGLQSPE